tara:strand:- start:3158 stop:3718 length:561 start_codon:yes stop_codon:yes gene_type:complete
MQYEIVTISPTVSSGLHATGDVVFNLTEVKLPATSCKLTSVFLTATGLGTSEKESFLVTKNKVGVLFFKKNTQPTLGTLNATADISAADFALNEYIGQTCIASPAGGSTLKTVLSDVGFLFPASINTDTIGANHGEHGSVFEPMVLKGAGDNKVYAAGVLHAEEMSSYGLNFGATDNVKIHFHFEY